MQRSSRSTMKLPAQSTTSPLFRSATAGHAPPATPNRRRRRSSVYFEQFRPTFRGGRRLSFLLRLFQFSFYFRLHVRVVVHVLVRLLQSTASNATAQRCTALTAQCSFFYSSVFCSLVVFFNFLGVRALYVLCFYVVIVVTVQSRRRDGTGQNAQNMCGDLGNW